MNIRLIQTFVFWNIQNAFDKPHFSSIDHRRFLTASLLTFLLCSQCRSNMLSNLGLDRDCICARLPRSFYSFPYFLCMYGKLMSRCRCSHMMHFSDLKPCSYFVHYSISIRSTDSYRMTACHDSRGVHLWTTRPR